VNDLFVPRDPQRVTERLRRPPTHGGTPLRGMLSVAMLLLSLIALGLLTMVRDQIAAQVASPMAAKLQAADRVLYYEFDDYRGPKFQLSPTDRSLKLITHLVLPADTGYDEKAEFHYGVELRLTNLAGDLLWSQVVDIGTRQSKDGGTERGWLLENSFLIADERELTDDRLTRIHLPPAGPGQGDRLLELRLRPERAQGPVLGLVRVYARRPRAVDDRTLRELSLAPDQRRELVDQLTYRDWDQLSEAEQTSKLRWVWDRLAALGEPEIDYQTLSVYETGFRLPRESEDDVRWLRVDPLRSLAFNVVGPAELELRSHAVDPVSAAARLQVHRLHVDGSHEPLAITDARQRLHVPAGVQTLFLTSDRPVDVELRVIEGESDPVRFSDRPLRIGDDGSEQLEPDLRKIPTIWLHPAREGVGPQTLASDGHAHRHDRPSGARYRVSLDARLPTLGAEPAPPGDPASRRLRFDVRYVARFAHRWPDPPPPKLELELCFLDDEGTQLQPCEPWAGTPPIRSPFEGRRVEAIADEQERWYPVSEPQSVQVIVPEHVAIVEIRSEQSLLIRGYGYWPEVPNTLADPWLSASGEPTRWRYPVLDTRTWFPLLPINHEALEEHGLTADLIAQVRLLPIGGLDGWSEATGEGEWWAIGRPDPYGRGGAWDPGPWVTVDPLGRHLRRSLLEQLEPGAEKRLREHWDGSLFSELVIGRDFTVDLSAAGPKAPEVHYQTKPDLLGQTLVVRVGDRVVRHQLTSTRGRVRLPVESGRARLNVAVEGLTRPALDAWIDRPILIASPPVSRRRVVHELTSRSLVIPIEKQPGEPMILNVVVYVPDRTAQATLRVAIDDGDPARVEGKLVERFTQATHEYRLDAHMLIDERDEMVDLRQRVRFVDLEGPRGVPLDVVTIPVVLGDDIAPGRHEIRVELGEGRAWIRAFHRGVGERSKPATAWTETIDAGEAEW
jgi:hypothetical protein